MTSALIETAKTVLPSLSAAVFLAGSDENPHRLTLHVANPSRTIGDEAEAAFRRSGHEVRCRVRKVKASHSRRSLEAALRPFCHRELVYDPTESVARGFALLRLAASLRAQLGDAVADIYLEPQSRTLFLVVPENKVASGNAIDDIRRGEIEAKVAAAIAVWNRDQAALPLSFRLCLAAPDLPVVPVDKRSFGAQSMPLRTVLHSGLVIGGIASLVGGLFPAIARADGPAVSAMNGKVAIEGGELNKAGTGIATGNFTVPLGQNFGASLDGLGGIANGQGVWGLGGQAFWRDPQMGLVGGFADHVHRDLRNDTLLNSVETTRYGAEGELYLGRFTPKVAVGYQDLSQGLPASSGAFGVVDLAWYPIDNLQLSGGGDFSRARSRALLGAEYLTGTAALPGLSIFGEAGITGERDSYAMVGFRYYFGPDKTLIRRHREDDPSLMSAASLANTYPVLGNY